MKITIVDPLCTTHSDSRSNSKSRNLHSFSRIIILVVVIKLMLTAWRTKAWMWATDECREARGASISTHSILAPPTRLVLVVLFELAVLVVLVSLHE